MRIAQSADEFANITGDMNLGCAHCANTCTRHGIPFGNPLSWRFRRRRAGAGRTVIVCGICGFVSGSSNPSAALQETVRRMTRALAHRGPDGEGIWVDGSAGAAFGHRRLAVIDLSPGGHQPMISASGRYVITYNGEIYNYRELRAELAAAGTHFRSQSDTEVLVEACARWGVEAAARRLNGIFAFALWDARDRVLNLVRDQIGVKPLYWGKAGSDLVFGSELKALASHPAWRPEIDHNAVSAYFRHNYVPAPHTIYRGVFKLEPGHILTLRPHQEPLVVSYWDARSVMREGATQRLTLSDAEATDQLEALLRDAVGRQMISDVPLGAFLSGGIDSSTVVALMQAQSTRPVKTFTIGFHEAAYDEARHAKAVARHLATDHTEVYASPDDAKALIPRLADWFDEPFADSSQIPTYLVSEMTRRHVTVALSGDGGDEVFAGYDRYRTAEVLWRSLRVLPTPLRRAMAGSLSALSPAHWDRMLSLVPGRWRPRQIGDKVHKFAAIIALGDQDAVYRRLISQWKDPDGLVIGGREPRGILWDATLAGEIPDVIARMQYLDTVTYLPDDILTKVDRTSMAVALEARVPLLDPRIVTFGGRLPRHLRMRSGKAKWLLRQVLYRYVPAPLIDRPKMGFGVPIDRWLRGPLRDWAEDLLGEQRLEADGILDPRPVRRLWREHMCGHRNWQHPLWCVLMFQEWKRRWIDGASPLPAVPDREATLPLF